jgi:hypothetical protein
MRTPRTRRTSRPGLALLAGTCALLAIAGCQYQNAPAIESSHGVLQDPNNPTPVRLMSTAIRFVAARYDPQTRAMMEDPAGPLPNTVGFPLAIGCPEGLRAEKYQRVARDIGANCVPLTQSVLEDGTLPVWYVARVWVRQSTATVDVYRPMNELPPGPDGKPVYSMITVRFEGYYNDWRAIHARTWGPGDFPKPTPYFMPAEGGDEAMSEIDSTPAASSAEPASEASSAIPAQ